MSLIDKGHARVADGSIDLGQLAGELIAAAPDLDKPGKQIAAAVYRLLAAGEPVSRERLAKRVGLSLESVAAALDSWPGVYTNDEGSVVGFWGLTQLEMPPHRLEVKGRKLYTWCAWDSLFIPQILRSTAQVESTSPTRGDSISLVVGPNGIESVTPEHAVLSFLRPREGFDEKIIQNFCHYILFSSDESGKQWTAEHENTFLLSTDEGFQLGPLWIEGLFGDLEAG